MAVHQDFGIPSQDILFKSVIAARPGSVGMTTYLELRLQGTQHRWRKLSQFGQIPTRQNNEVTICFQNTVWDILVLEPVSSDAPHGLNTTCLIVSVMNQLSAYDEENETVQEVRQEDAEFDCWDTKYSALVSRLAQLGNDEDEQEGEHKVKEHSHLERLFDVKRQDNLWT